MWHSMQLEIETLLGFYDGEDFWVEAHAELSSFIIRADFDSQRCADFLKQRITPLEISTQ